MTYTRALEIAEGLLPDGKLWIRRTTNSLNDEVKQTTAACLLDMKGVGIENIKAEDPLIQQAVKMYLRAQFGYDDKPEIWAASYEHLKAALSLNSDYRKSPDGEVNADG